MHSPSGKAFGFFLLKVFALLFALMLSIWFLLSLEKWAFGWKGYLLKVGDWNTLIFLAFVVIIVKIILEKLLRWQVRASLR